MKHRLLNDLACPYCKDKGFPLKLITIEVCRREERRILFKMPRPLCDTYFAYKGAFIKELEEIQPCNECLKFGVVRPYCIVNSVNGGIL